MKLYKARSNFWGTRLDQHPWSEPRIPIRPNDIFIVVGKYSDDHDIILLADRGFVMIERYYFGRCRKVP